MDKTNEKDLAIQLQEKLANVDELTSRLDELQTQLDATKEKAPRGTAPWFNANEKSHGTSLRDPEAASHSVTYMKALAQGDTKKLKELQDSAPGLYLQKANFNETTSTQGGLGVPTPIEDAVYEAYEEYGYVQRLFRNVPMTSRTLGLARGNSISASFAAEGAAATLQDSTNFFTATTLTAKLAKAAALWTEELQEDANPAFIAHLMEEMGRGLAAEVDRVGFVGDVGGASDAFDGVTVVSNTNTVYLGGAVGSGNTAFANISWTDLVPMITAVPTGALKDPCFVMPVSVFQALRVETATSSDKTPVFPATTPILAGQIGTSAVDRSTYWTPLGYKAVVVPDAVWNADGAGAAAAVFGDFGVHAVYGVRRGITAKTFDQYYNSTALSGQNVVVEMSQRIGIAFPEPDAFAVLKTAAS